MRYGATDPRIRRDLQGQTPRPRAGRRRGGQRPSYGLLVRLTDDQCRAYFSEARVARLATIAEDGSPRVVPVTFALAPSAADGEVIVSAVDHKPKSTTDLARLRRIADEPRVSFLADAYSEDWSELWWVRADAHAEVLTAGPLWSAAVAQLQDKYGQYRQRPPAHAIIRAVVRHWSGWAAGTRRTM